MSLDEELAKIFEKKKGTIMLVCASEESQGLLDKALDYAQRHSVDLNVVRPGNADAPPDFCMYRIKNNLTFAATALEQGMRLARNSMGSPVLLYMDDIPEGLNDAINKMFDIIYEVPFTVADCHRRSMSDILAAKIMGLTLPSDTVNGLVSSHSYKNDIWKQFIPYIDESLRAGNSQTEIEYQFLVLSDRQAFNLGEYEDHKKKLVVKPSDHEISAEELDGCAAIFVDNQYNSLVHETCLGDGIETLRRTRQRLDELGIDLPIIYQSGHESSSFTDEELEAIAEQGAFLAAKDVFPKVTLNKTKAEKEITVSKIASEDPRLKPYIVQVTGPDHPIGDEFHVTMTTMAQPQEDIERQAMFHTLGIQDDAYSTRMYALALFHSVMEDHVDDNIEAVVPQFLTFEQLQKRLSYFEFLEEFKPLYGQIVTDPAHYETRTISHNDAKDDNWFEKVVLGDFANAAPGTEYKDVARALITEDTQEIASHTDLVTEYIDNYIDVREEIGRPIADDRETFHKRVLEAVFTESIRMAAFKDERSPGHALVKYYMCIARQYHDMLSDAPVRS